MGRDITAQRLAEEALAIERDLVRALMDGVPDYIYSKDLSGHFVRVNRAFASSHGRATAAEIIGTTDFDFFEKDLAEAFRESEQRIMETGAAAHRHRRAQRSARWAKSDGCRRRRCLCATGTATWSAFWESREDITERKRGEERLMRSDKMASLGRLTAGIAHEMNTPLAAARAGLAELAALVAEYKRRSRIPRSRSEDHRPSARK